MKNAKNACATQRDATVVAALVGCIAEEDKLALPAMPKSSGKIDRAEVQRNLAVLQADVVKLDFHELTWEDVFGCYAHTYEKPTKAGRRRKSPAKRISFINGGSG